MFAPVGGVATTHSEKGLAMKLGSRCKVYVNEYEEFSTRGTEYEATIIVDDSQRDTCFICSKDFPGDFGIKVVEKCKNTWADPSNTYICIDDVEQFYGLRGQWVPVDMVVMCDGSAPVSTRVSKRQEKPCEHCKRSNDVGVGSCWWCGNKPF